MESPQIVYIQSLIAELKLQGLANDESCNREEERKKINIRVLNKKISGLYKQKIINQVEIVKLRNEKRNILDDYNFSNYIGLQCNRRLNNRFLILNNQLEDIINNNC